MESVDSSECSKQSVACCQNGVTKTVSDGAEVSKPESQDRLQQNGTNGSTADEQTGDSSSEELTLGLHDGLPPLEYIDGDPSTKHKPVSTVTTTVTTRTVRRRRSRSSSRRSFDGEQEDSRRKRPPGIMDGIVKSKSVGSIKTQDGRSIPVLHFVDKRRESKVMPGGRTIDEWKIEIRQTWRWSKVFNRCNAEMDGVSRLKVRNAEFAYEAKMYFLP